MTALLLRLLLIATLVLNGSGAAMASVRMAQGLPTIPSAAVSTTPSVAHPHVRQADHAKTADAVPIKRPCHDAAIARSGGDAAMDRDHARPAADHPASPSDPEGHCDAGTCQCACLHIAQMAAGLSRVAAVAVGASVMPSPRSDAHAAPSLPHLMRPPIV